MKNQVVINTNMILRKLLVISCLYFTLPAMAQEEKKNTYGGWEFIEVSYNFKKAPLYASIYFEHDNYEYKQLDCWYTRTTFGVKILPWLKADVAYDFLYEPGGVLTHKALFNLTGTLTQGNLKVSLRERYVHDWLADEGKQDNVLRSQLKAQYAIPKSHFSPYLAIEVFTWETWKKTRHYVGCTFDINKTFQLEAYYMYYTFKNAPAEHVIGLGLNISL